MVVYKVVNALNISSQQTMLKADTIVSELRSIEDYTTRYLQIDVECKGEVIHVSGISMQKKYGDIKAVLNKYGINKVVKEENGRFVHMLSYDPQLMFHIEVIPIHIQQQTHIPEPNTASRRIKENAIMIEIQELCKILLETVQITPFMYIPKSAFDEQYYGENADIEMSEFNKWYKNAENTRDSLKAKFASIRENILAMEPRSKEDKCQKQEDNNDISLHESLEYLGMPLDVAPTKQVVNEIRRRYRLKLNGQNIADMQKIRKTLSQYGFFAKIQKKHKIRRREKKESTNTTSNVPSFF